MKTRIPIKRYEFDPSLSWEQSYRLLEAHHRDETEFLISVIEGFEKEDFCYDCGQPTATRWCGSAFCT